MKHINMQMCPFTSHANLFMCLFMEISNPDEGGVRNDKFL